MTMPSVSERELHRTTSDSLRSQDDGFYEGNAWCRDDDQVIWPSELHLDQRITVKSEPTVSRGEIMVPR